MYSLSLPLFTKYGIHHLLNKVIKPSSCKVIYARVFNNSGNQREVRSIRSQVAYLLYLGFSFHVKPIARVKLLTVCSVNDIYAYMVLIIQILVTFVKLVDLFNCRGFPKRKSESAYNIRGGRSWSVTRDSARSRSSLTDSSERDAAGWLTRGVFLRSIEP